MISTTISHYKILSKLGEGGMGVVYKAEDISKDLIAKDPQGPLSKWQLGFILIDNEINVDEGMKLINQALEIEPDNYSFLDTNGWGLYKQGQLEEALHILEKSWEAIPYYNHEHYQHIQEVEQALASQNK